MKFNLLIIFSSLIAVSVFPQETDTTVINQGDTLFTLPDTLASVDTIPRRSDVDTTIFAEASDSLIFFVKKKEMKIYGDASLQYKETDLRSANIFVDFETNMIEAEGTPSDSLPGKFEQTPVLSEKGEVYKGFRMKYNFKTGRGNISTAQTEQEGAIYTGAKIKKVDPETYFIEDGVYTTCDVEEPHYHFYAKEMKVIHKQQVMAKWIWLNFGQVPFPIPFPFAVFPIESGRRSGILAPAFGQDASRGYYFSRFGYFWAMSDYMDLNLTGDYFTRGSYNLSTRFRYARRYNFTGYLEGGYSFIKSGEETDINFSESNEWRIKWIHNQTIDPSMRFDANLEFTSGSNFLRRTTTDYSQLLRNDIVSNATLFKSWDNGNSASLNYSRRQDLESGNINEILPNFSFNMPQRYPFKSDVGRGDNWYEMIGYRYSNQFRNNRNKIDGNLEIRAGAQHNITIGASPKIGYFNFNPNINYTERWYNKRIERTTIESPFTGEDTVVTRDVNEINFVRSFSLGVNAATKFYGTFQPNALGVAAVRHTVIPTIGYSYQPDFSQPGWGYYDTYINEEGRTETYNKFEREIFGAPPARESQNINFGLDNIFEMKTIVDPTDTTSKEKKIQLLNLGAGISYNFAADSLNFSDLRLNFRSQISDIVNFSGNSTFTLYETSPEGRSINKLLINEGKGLMRLTNIGFSVSTTLSGERLRSKEDELRDTLMQEDQYRLGSTEEVYKGVYDMQEADFTIPWDISLSYNYQLNKTNPATPQAFSSISGGVNFNLTPNWKFSFSGNYDLERKEFAAPQVRISRDLHCWLMNFTWTPIGTFRGYRFEIKVKAPQLQDLKVTKADQFFSGKR